MKQDEEAVSPVIGVILMVAITVVLAAVVFVLVSDLQGPDNKAPDVAFRDMGGGDLMVATTEDGLTWGDLTVTGCLTVPLDVETVDAGDLLQGCSGRVVVAHDATNTVIYTATV